MNIEHPENELTNGQNESLGYWSETPLLYNEWKEGRDVKRHTNSVRMLVKSLDMAYSVHKTPLRWPTSLVVTNVCSLQSRVLTDSKCYLYSGLIDGVNSISFYFS